MKKDEIKLFRDYPYAELNSQDDLYCFKICTYNYAYPKADNRSDADWHRNYLYFTLPGFRVEVNEIILEGQFVQFIIKELEQFSLQKKENVVIEPTEPFFGFTLSLRGPNKVNVEGYIQYPVGQGTELIFEFETDLKNVNKFLTGLKAIEREYPSRNI
ncbi:WapI family immunity protein [Bacillus sp. FJAT-45037]|uniref:WapI family immunity protein n=1 Tax=Bacillus sp. FJAT-45037 TaxID=2011007 RepID=UPI000C23C004|nr:hypothetical protein [Bacillus sp. FJAT-45037]